MFPKGWFFLLPLAMATLVSLRLTPARAFSRIRRQGISFMEDPAMEDDCQTSDLKPGLCIALTECPELFNQLTNSPTPNFIAYLRRNVCRFAGFVPFVCCSKETEAANQPPVLVIASSPSSASVPTTVSEGTTTTGTEPPTTVPLATTTVEPPFLEVLQKICGRSNRTAIRIVGGKVAEKGSWPWIAVLGYKNGQGKVNFLCGGTLVSDKHILTAAHCVYRRGDLSTVRLGEHDLSTTGEAEHEDFKIVSKKIHKDYSPTTYVNDIAVLTLDRPVSIRPHLSPVCLPIWDYFENNTFEGFLPFAAGWGSIAYNNVSSPELKEVQVPVVPTEKCATQYSRFSSVSIGPKTLCAGDTGKDACQGDSGGPLMMWYDKQYYLIGVVSLGFRCGEPNYPGIYTRVSEYLDWIESTLKEE